MPSLRGALSTQNTFLPPLMYRRVTIPSAQWLTLLGSPVTLIPAISGKSIVVEGIQYFVKLSGVAYNNAAVTELRGAYTGSGTLWLQITQAQLTGFTDVVTQSIFIATNPRVMSVIANGGVVNGGITIFTTGGNFAAGDSDFIFWLSYRIYDVSNLAWF